MYNQNMLVEICEGRGEIIGSKLLAYFLIKDYCGPLRNLFNLGDITPKQVETEKVYSEGRIDIHIEDVLVGIEVKFWHKIDSEQLEKYLKHGECKTLFLVVPEARKQTAEDISNKYNNVTVISWEEILKKLEKIETDVSSEDRFRIKEYRIFIEHMLGIPTDKDYKIIEVFEWYKDECWDYWENKDNWDCIYRVLSYAQNVLPNSSRKSSSKGKRKKYFGFYFYKSTGEKFWFGLSQARKRNLKEWTLEEFKNNKWEFKESFSFDDSDDFYKKMKGYIE